MEEKIFFCTFAVIKETQQKSFMGRNLKSIVFVLLALMCVEPSFSQKSMDKMWGSSGSSGASPAKEGRGRLFSWGNYAMFIHWGLYSSLGNVWNGNTYYGISEWILNKNMANIDRSEYRAIAKRFNPSEFDAMKIAQLAKDAGMKYIVITSKHHEGFAMYHSKVDKFNIVDTTPFGRDPMKELSEACKKLGLGFGFYYSHNQDWTYPGGNGGPAVDSEGNPKTIDDYFYEKCLPQIDEITKNYGDMEIIWLDTPGRIPKEYVEKIVDVIHRNQPHVMVSGRAGYDLGDYRTLDDMEIPIENIDGLWETVDVTNDSWGYAWYDNNWKSPKEILQYLITTVARGGTYMLNVGPDALGRIPEGAQMSLRASGKWIERHPQMVYGAQPSPWKHALPWGDVVQQGNKLYLAIFNWPTTGRLYLPGLKTQVKSAALLGGKKPQRLSMTKDGKWTVLSLPATRPDELVNVVELTMTSENIDVDNQQALDPETGVKNMSVRFATTDGCEMYKSNWMEKFGEWKHVYCVNKMKPSSRVSWTLEFKDPGMYAISLNVRGSGKCVWKVESDEDRFIQNQQRASDLFADRPIGWLKIDKGGTHTISVSMLSGDEKTDLAAITITPVPFE